MPKFIFSYGLQGSKSLSRLLCFIVKYLGVDAFITLGDIVSPSIIYWLNKQCGVRVLGVLGKYDNVAVASALKKIEGLLECHDINISGVKFYGLGFTGCNSLVHLRNVDIFVSSLPGVNYTCCNPCTDLVDQIIERVNPLIIAVGNCKSPCKKGKVISPGSVRLGYICIVEFVKPEAKVLFTNISQLVYELAKDS